MGASRPLLTAWLILAGIAGVIAVSAALDRAWVLGGAAALYLTIAGILRPPKVIGPPGHRRPVSVWQRLPGCAFCGLCGAGLLYLALNPAAEISDDLPMAVFTGAAAISLVETFAGPRVSLFASDTEMRTAKTEIAPDDQALLILMREGSVASRIPLEVYMDGAGLAKAFGGGFTTHKIVPGEHTLSASFEDPSSPRNSGPARLSFTATAGKRIAVRIHVAMDMIACRLTLEAMSDEAVIQPVLEPLRLVA